MGNRSLGALWHNNPYPILPFHAKPNERIGQAVGEHFHVTKRVGASLSTRGEVEESYGVRGMPVTAVGANVEYGWDVPSESQSNPLVGFASKDTHPSPPAWIVRHGPCGLDAGRSAMQLD